MVADTANYELECQHRNAGLMEIEAGLRMGGIGETIYDQLLALSKIRLDPSGGRPVTTGRWGEFLQALLKHSQWLRAYCAPGAVLLMLLDIELLLTSLVDVPTATCHTVAQGVAQLKTREDADYDQLRARVAGAQLQEWHEVIDVAEQLTAGSLAVVESWARRCQQLEESSPVALACWNPFQAPAPGGDHVCLDGLSELGKASTSSFWHFMRGFFVEVFRALLTWRAPEQIRSLRVQFGDLTYPCDTRNNFMDFFGSILDHPVTVDPGCELSQLWHLPVLQLRPVPDIARTAPGSLGSEVKVLRRHLAQFLGHKERSTNLFLHLQRVTGPSTASRRPSNAKMLRRAARQVCVQSRLRCLDLALEDLSWAKQLQLLLRTHAIVAYHGSGLGAAQFWLQPGAAVLEFMPSGCWWCVFAVDAQQRPALTWLISTTKDAPRAQLPGTSHPLIGCNGDPSACVQTFAARRDAQRHVALRGFQVLRVALRRGRRAALSLRDVHSACGGAALQVYETGRAPPDTRPA